MPIRRQLPSNQSAVRAESSCSTLVVTHSACWCVVGHETCCAVSPGATPVLAIATDERDLPDLEASTRRRFAPADAFGLDEAYIGTPQMIADRIHEHAAQGIHAHLAAGAAVTGRLAMAS